MPKMMLIVGYFFNGIGTPTHSDLTSLFAGAALDCPPGDGVPLGMLHAATAALYCNGEAQQMR